MTEEQRARELERLAAAACAAGEGGDGWHAGELWRRYELVRDAGRDPDELLAEGLALSRVAMDLAEQAPPLDRDGLLARSDMRRVDGTEAPICALEDLVAMKRQTGRTTDLEDLHRLEIAHGELREPPPAAE